MGLLKEDKADLLVLEIGNNFNVIASDLVNFSKSIIFHHCVLSEQNTKSICVISSDIFSGYFNHEKFSPTEINSSGRN